MATSTTILDRISAVMRVQAYFPPAVREDVIDVERQLGVHGYQVLDVDIFGVWAREQRRWDELDAAP